jgi:hypothetical protein
MAALEPLCLLIGIEPGKLSTNENMILEFEFIYQIYAELKEIFRAYNKEYYRLIQFSYAMENVMLEKDFMNFVIKDILSTGLYTVDGIANYIGKDDEVVNDILVGRNDNPSLNLFRGIIQLHKNVRGDIYKNIMARIINKLPLLKLL